jgi:hypothetical protein
MFRGPLRGKCVFIEKEALYPVIEHLSSVCNEENFSNGRHVRNLVEKIENHHIYNVRDCENIEQINIITLKDIQEALK